MKLASATSLIILLSAALTGTLWRLWQNGRDLAVLRREMAQFSADRGPPSGATGSAQPDPSAAADRTRPRPTPAPPATRRDPSTEADFASLPAEERAEFLKQWRKERDRKRAAEEAEKALAERNKGPEAASYAGGKATGPPDAHEDGSDSSNAWCAAPRSAGGEWLKLSYGRPVDIAEIAIHETYATGALSRVVAMTPDGGERVLWEGTEPVEKPPVQRIVQVPAGVRSDQIRIELDTTRTNNWQEIDAVELIGRDGSRQWAREAEGSSYWGSGSATQKQYELGFSLGDLLQPTSR